jgi:hypothetical protein
MLPVIGDHHEIAVIAMTKNKVASSAAATNERPPLRLSIAAQCPSIHLRTHGTPALLQRDGEIVAEERDHRRVFGVSGGR